MSDYWMSTKSNPRLFKKSYQTAELDKIIIETQGLDAALLTQDLKMSASQIRAYRRQLGIVACEF